MGEMPLVRVELERMRMSIVAAMTAHVEEINKQINEKVQEYCTEERLTNVIQQQVQSSIDGAIRSEIESYYRSGPGRTVIMRAVRESLGGGE